MAERWTQLEVLRWVEFLRGDFFLPPGNRSPEAVMERLSWSNEHGAVRCAIDNRPRVSDWPSASVHAASMEAIGILKKLPHRRSDQLRDDVDTVVKLACGDIQEFVGSKTSMNAIHKIREDVLHRAIIATRQALKASLASPAQGREDAA